MSINGTLLLIDYNSTFRDATAAILKEYNYDVLTAKTGKEGAAHFEKGGIDLVITDLNLPDTTGQHVAAGIHAGDPTIPIIYITGEDINVQDALSNANEAKENGILGYFEKPIVDYSKLVSTIDYQVRVQSKRSPKIKDQGAILVFEHNREYESELDRLYSPSGYSVFSTGDIDEALQIARVEHIDLAIVNNQVHTEDDGLVLAEHLHKKYPLVELVLMSEKKDTADFARIHDISEFYVTKPFQMGLYISKIDSALKKRKEALVSKLQKGDPTLWLICGPSGVGKSWTADGVQTACPWTQLGRPTTSRGLRDGEIEGQYKFHVSGDVDIIDNSQFSLTYQLHDSYWVGIDEAEIFPNMQRGYDVILTQTDPRNLEKIRERYQTFVRTVLLQENPAIIHARQKENRENVQSEEEIVAHQEAFYGCTTFDHTLVSAQQLGNIHARTSSQLEPELATDVENLSQILKGHRFG